MRSTLARHKITTLKDLTRRIDRARRAGNVIVFTNGCFDLVHVGHVRARRVLPEDQGLGQAGDLGALHARESLGQRPRARSRYLGANLGQLIHRRS